MASQTAGNPNTCDHGYRLETSICPVAGCIANADGERVGDTGPVLASGPAHACRPARIDCPGCHPEAHTNCGCTAAV